MAITPGQYALNQIEKLSDKMKRQIENQRTLVLDLDKIRNWKEYNWQAGKLAAYKEIKAEIDNIIDVSRNINDIVFH